MRIPIRVRSLGVILTMLAVASGCKKNPTAPEESNGDLASDGAVVQAMRGGRPACLPHSTVSSQGIDFMALHRACLSLGVDATGDTFVTVSNIGSSGRDGVDIHYAAPQALVQTDLDLVDIDGLSVRDRWIGPRGRFATVLHVGPLYPAGWEQVVGVIAPNLRCRPAHLALTNGGVVVWQGSVSCETSGQFKGAYLLAHLTGSAPTSMGIERGYLDHRPGGLSGGQFQMEGEFPDGPIAVTVPSGQTVVIGGFRLTAAVAAPAMLERTDVTAAGAGTARIIVVNVDRPPVL